MNYQIKLADDKLHPVKFGMGALYQYEVKTGRSAIADFMEVASAGTSPKLSIIIDLLYAGFICGYKQFKKQPPFDQEGLAELLSQDKIQELMKLFEQSFPQPNADDEADSNAGNAESQVTA